MHRKESRVNKTYLEKTVSLHNPTKYEEPCFFLLTG